MRISLISAIFIILILLKPVNLFSFQYYTESLPKWIELLKNGNEKEKILALHSLWFLEYPEYRKDVRVFAPILEALKDKNPSIREAAAASLKKIGELSKGCCNEPIIVPSLIDDLDDINPQARAEAAMASLKVMSELLSKGCCKETALVPSLIDALNDGNTRVRGEAAKALAYYKDSRAVAPLIKMLQDKDPWVRLNAVFSLGELGAHESNHVLLDLLDDDSGWRNKFVQQECLIALGKTRNSMAFSDKKIVSVLMKKFNDSYLQEEIIKTLGHLRAKEAMDLLISATKDSNERIRKSAIEAISRMPKDYPEQKQAATSQKESMATLDAQQIDIYIKALADPAAEVRLQSVEALVKLRDKRTIEPLLSVLNDKSEKVRHSASKALANFTDERILDGLTKHLGEHHIQESFLSIAKKTCQKQVQVYRINGIRNVVEKQMDIPKDVNSRELIVHKVAVDKLIAALNSNDKSIELGVLAITNFFEDERIEPLLIKYLDNPSADLRLKASSNLYSAGTNKAVPKLIINLKDKVESIREKAADALGWIMDERAKEPLIAALNDASDKVKAAAISSLINFDDPRVSDLVIPSLKDKSLSVRTASVKYIIKKPDRRAVDDLILLLNDADWYVAGLVASALGIIGDKKAVDPLIKVLKGEFNRNRALNGDAYLKSSAAAALGKIGDKKAVPALIGVLEEREVSVNAIIALRSIKDKSAVPALVKCLSSQDFYVRKEAAAALKEIEGIK